MSTHVFTFWPALPGDEPHRALRPQLGWCAAIGALAPWIVLAAAVSLTGMAWDRVRARCGRPRRQPRWRPAAR